MVNGSGYYGTSALSGGKNPLLQPHQAVTFHHPGMGVRLYRQGGGKLKSLDPMGRNDRGGSRALDEDNAQVLVRLCRELPIASVITLISEIMR
ncbi:hypothetical protein DFAR_2190002 [Desulfarculales bacterium]